MPKQSQASPRLLTTILVGSAFLSGIDLFIVNVAFDEIGRDLGGPGGATLSSLSWILNAYAVIFAALLVPMGRLTDRYGRKAGFVAGLALFTVASAACGVSTGVWELVAFRGLQAVGAAAMTPASLGLLLAALPPERRAPAARLWATTGALAAALGPAVGGVLVQLSWHWAFFINVPVGVVLVVAAIRLVPDVRHNQDAPRPDLSGAVLLAVTVGALVLALVQGPDWGWSSAKVLGAVAVAVAALAAFVVQSGHHPSPVIDPALLRVRSFTWAGVTMLVFHVGFGINLLGGILWMQQVWGYGPLRTGLGVALGPLMVPITSIVAHRLLPRARPSLMVAAGCVVGAAGSALTVLLLTTEPSFWTTSFPGRTLIGISVGLVVPNLVASATSPLPAAQTSTGSGVITMARQVGLVLGVAVLVSILASSTDVMATFGTAFWLAGGLLLLSTGAAVAMQSARRTVAEPVPTPG